MNELREYIYYPENPWACINLATRYEEQGYIATAVSFYLRAVEFAENPILEYSALLRLFLCFEKTPKRWHTCRSILTRAISLYPKRPEAHYLLARYLQRMNEPAESYNQCELALYICDFGLEPLPLNVEYQGKWNFYFEKGVVAWWADKPDVARNMFRMLAEQYRHEMDSSHFNSVKSNLSKLGCGPHSQAFVYYNQKDYNNMRVKFSGLEKIVHNYSQIYQDMFVLSALEGKEFGTYLEIGSADPKYGNNTYILETEFYWTGVGIEFNPSLVSVYEQHRKNPVICKNALEVDYEKVLSDLAVDGVVDYLQLDCEPSEVTFEIMTKIPFDKYKFRVITYEHDDYIDIDKKYKRLSREFLLSKGYKLVVSDLSPDGISNFEDWWVHPDLVSKDTFFQLKDVREETKKVDEYFLQKGA